jgi:hypothetical protein
VPRVFPGRFRKENNIGGSVGVISPTVLPLSLHSDVKTHNLYKRNYKKSGTVSCNVRVGGANASS